VANRPNIREVSRNVEPLPAGGAADLPLRAVIDIGSNSVRLVVFDGPERAPLPRFNEKVMCGLGRDLNITGRLSDSGMKETLRTMQRFGVLLRQLGVERPKAVATAALREAENGREFVAELERVCDLSIDVLSGEDEARYSALGVLSGLPEADGVVGDLGGGSLELVSVAKGEPGQSATLPLGALRIMAQDAKRREMEEFIERHLDTVDWLEAAKGREFYVVGGAWRSIARVHMAQEQYPLHIIDSYTLRPDDIEAVTAVLSRQSAASVARLANIAGKRVGTIRAAALLLDRLILRLAPKQVVFSAQGLREGLIYSELSGAARKRDPLMDACRDMAFREDRSGQPADAMLRWLTCLLPEKGADRRLFHAATILRNVAWRVHPDYRAEQSFRRVLRAQFIGISHRDRAMMALALYIRYGGRLKGQASAPARGLLSEKDTSTAQIFGLGLRLAQYLSAGEMEILQKANLQRTAKTLTLNVHQADSDLIGESVEKRLAQLAKAMQLKPRVKVIDPVRPA
jgi:exopolyphosphatase/guanosine-5'-triphosphate,3'-diphosphate pyrophosphatase